MPQFQRLSINGQILEARDRSLRSFYGPDNLDAKPMKSGDDLKRQPMDMPLARVPLGEVHVIVERCKECGYCIEYCPTKVLVYTKKINAKGYHYPIVAAGKESACVHCRYCDLICPELAIYTTVVEPDKGADPND